MFRLLRCAIYIDAKSLIFASEWPWLCALQTVGSSGVICSCSINLVSRSLPKNPKGQTVRSGRSIRSRFRSVSRNVAINRTAWRRVSVQSRSSSSRYFLDALRRHNSARSSQGMLHIPASPSFRAYRSRNRHPLGRIMRRNRRRKMDPFCNAARDSFDS